MRRRQPYPVLSKLFQPFHATQRKTLAAIVRAIIRVGEVSSFAVATWMADRRGIRLDSALNRFYRLLRNARIDDLLLSTQMLRTFTGGLGDRLLVAVDWTEWHPPLRMLVAAVVVGTRAVPVHVGAFPRSLVPRSQNSRENAFTTTLAMVLRAAGRRAVILADRGFRRASYLVLLLRLRLSFVIRIMDDVCVHVGGEVRPLNTLGLQPGEIRDLGWVELREDGVVRVRVVGIWQCNRAEPWWLATDLDVSVCEIAAYYDRRMCIEEQFRDTKGCRFGARLFWAQHRKPERLARALLLLGIAAFVWLAVGALAVDGRRNWQLDHPTKGPRLSFLTIGRRLAETVRLRVPLTAPAVRSYLPPPRLRRFSWIEAKR